MWLGRGWIIFIIVDMGSKESMLAESYDENESLSTRDMEQGGT